MSKLQELRELIIKTLHPEVKFEYEVQAYGELNLNMILLALDRKKTYISWDCNQKNVLLIMSKKYTHPRAEYNFDKHPRSQSEETISELLKLIKGE